MHGRGIVELPFGNMSLTCYDVDDDDGGGDISNIFSCFLSEKHIILMTFNPTTTLRSRRNYSRFFKVQKIWNIP